MRRLVLIGFILLLVPMGTWGLELGAIFRVAYSNVYDEVQYVSVGTPTTFNVYLSGFPHKKIALGGYTSLGYHWWSDSDNPNPWWRTFGLNSSFYLSEKNRSGLFLLGGVALYRPSHTKDTIASCGIGYQTVRDKPYIHKVTLYYSRWMDIKLNQVSLSLVFARRFER